MFIGLIEKQNIEFKRGRGKDKKKRKKRTLRNLAIGAAGVGLAGGALALAKKKKRGKTTPNNLLDKTKQPQKALSGTASNSQKALPSAGESSSLENRKTKKGMELWSKQNKIWGEAGLDAGRMRRISKRAKKGNRESQSTLRRVGKNAGRIQKARKS